MLYGRTKYAMEYAKRGAIDEWIQCFLRNDGENIALADGLLREKRYYFGPIMADISEFGVEEGAPSYLTKSNDIEWFFHVVNNMKEAYNEWDMPPLIINYSNGKYEINDGRHRNEALRQMNIKRAPVIFWTSTESEHRYIVDSFRGKKDS